MVELLDHLGCTVNHLQALAFGRGPGSFTGLRIACGVVQGLGFARNCPVFAIDTPEALAHPWLEHGQAILVLYDARMGELYGAWYPRDRPRADSASSESPMTQPNPAQPFVIHPDHLLSLTEKLGLQMGKTSFIAAGNAWRFDHPVIRALRAAAVQVEPDAYPRADSVMALAKLRWQAGHRPDAHRALPLYVRDQVALDKAGQQALRDARKSA